MTSKCCTRFAVGLVAIVTIGLSTVATASPAVAAGNADLKRLIIPSPVAWSPISESRSQSFSSYLNGVETAAIAPAGLTSTSAAGGWQDTATKRLLMIALVEINGNGITPSNSARFMNPAAKAGAASFCAGAEAAAPASLARVSGLPNAYLVVCPSAGSRSIPMGVSMTRANVLAFLISTQGSMSTQELESIARQQYAALPKSSPSPTSSSSGSTSPDFIAAGILVVFVTCLVVLVSIRRRKARREGSPMVTSEAVDPSGGPSAGWYADPIHPGSRRYWTGSQWGPDQSAAVLVQVVPDDRNNDGVLPPPGT